MRIVIAESSSDSSYSIIHTAREPVRLGEDAFRLGKLSIQIQDKAVMAANRFARVIKQFKVSAVRVVATSAMRESRNGSELIERIKKTTGFPVEVIAGEEEARLVHLAVSSKVRLLRRTALLIDVGGGSVEVTVVVRGNVVRAESLRLGTVRLLNTIARGDHQQRAIQRLVRNYARNMRRQLPSSVLRKGFDVCVGTGGNLECLGDLRRVIHGRTDTSRITLKELTGVIEELKPLKVAERCARYGLRLDRADVIMPAAYVIHALLTEVNVKEIEIPRVGLKDGVIIDLLGSAKQPYSTRELRSHRDQLRAFAAEVGEKYCYDAAHSSHVALLALQLFDSTKSVHGLNGDERVFLELAGLLHDTGRFIDTEDHHKHSSYIIAETSFVGLTVKHRQIISAICRYHRGALPSPQHRELSILSPKDRKRVYVLAALLRIANTLDREHVGNVQAASIQVGRGKSTLKVQGKGRLLVEQWAFEGAKEMFEKVFKRKIEWGGPEAKRTVKRSDRKSRRVKQGRVSR